ncbi:hypothetical protein ACA910_010684 [Epithemia clementina (nom. ined.)]
MSEGALRSAGNTTTATTFSSTTGALESALLRIKELGINFVAIDFDSTLIDIHTGGRWMGTVEELEGHIRPEFRQLLKAFLLNDIHVAIVTFTPQTLLVKLILEKMTQNDERLTKYIIPIRGGDKTWTYIGEGSRHGKQAHMASAVEELLQHHDATEITKRTTILIDDDRKNIRHALTDGTRAVWFNPDKPHHLLRDLAKLV